MALTLRPGLSFCEVGGKLVFLDLPRDRYFCLEASAEHAWRQLVEVGPVEDGTALPCLPSDLLVASADAASIVSCAPQLPFLNDRRSETAPRPSIIELVAASVELARAPLALRMLGLNGAISEVSRRKARLGPAPVDMTARLDSVTDTFTRLRRLISAHDRCLPRSIAIARRLTALGVAPTLTLGVKLQPFGAHCWVRCGDRLISDRWDDVRHFTPILVI